MTLTIRQLLEEIRRGHYEPDEAHPWMNDLFTAVDYRNRAVAALKALDEADRENRPARWIEGDVLIAEGRWYRLVPDPAPPTRNT